MALACSSKGNPSVGNGKKHIKLGSRWSWEKWRDTVIPSGQRLQFAIENGPVEIVSLPIRNGGSFLFFGPAGGPKSEFRMGWTWNHQALALDTPSGAPGLPIQDAVPRGED